MFTNPEKNLKFLSIQDHDIVADLGAGTGFYSIICGHMLPFGKVYAVELVKDFLDILKNKIKDAHLRNVDIIWGNIEKIGGTKIGDSVVDKVILSNVFSQTEDKDKVILEIKRILKNRGKLLFIDWSTFLFKSRQIPLSKNQIISMFNKQGFNIEREFDAGEHHYGIIFSINKNEK